MKRLDEGKGLFFGYNVFLCVQRKKEEIGEPHHQNHVNLNPGSAGTTIWDHKRKLVILYTTHLSFFGSNCL